MPHASVQHAFVSYVHEDAVTVDHLASALRAASIPVWKDTEALWPGEDWQHKIREAIEDGSLAFIACFSSSSTQKTKTYMNAELNLAVEQIRLMKPGRVWLIPVRLDECELPYFDLGGGRTLNSLQRIDLFGPDRDASLARLIAAIMGIFGTLTTSPASVAAAIAGSETSERGPRLAEALKAGIADPGKQMETEELLLGEVRSAIQAIGDEQRFPLGTAPDVVSMVQRAQEYDSLVRAADTRGDHTRGMGQRAVRQPLEPRDDPVCSSDGKHAWRLRRIPPSAELRSASGSLLWGAGCGCAA